MFNVVKLFSPMHYPINEIERTSAFNLWLEKLLDIFVTIENECDLYQVEMPEFVEKMKHACAHKNINKMWAHCNSTLEWWTNWLLLEQIMAKNSYYISKHSVVWMRFFKAKYIEECFTIALGVEQSWCIDVHIFIGINVVDLEWSNVIEWWRNMQDRQILSLGWLITIVSSFLSMYYFSILKLLLYTQFVYVEFSSLHGQIISNVNFVNFIHFERR